MFKRRRPAQPWTQHQPHQRVLAKKVPIMEPNAIFDVVSAGPSGAHITGNRQWN
jgi:hypothetical protein